MKLLVITDSYPPYQSGGYELRCKDVIDRLRQKGHEVFIITTRDENRELDHILKHQDVLRILKRRTDFQSIWRRIKNDFREIFFLDQKVRKFQPELIYLWNLSNLSNMILPYFSGQPFPIVYDEGGSGLIHIVKIYKRGLYFYSKEDEHLVRKIIKSIVYQSIYRLSRRLINNNWEWPQKMRIYFNSHSSMAYAQENGVPINDNCRVIYSGIDLSKFPYRHRNQLSSPLKIIVPGRIVEHKGTKDAVYLIKALVANNIPVRLIVVGKIWSRMYFEEIEQFVEDEGLTDWVEYQPMVSQDKLAQLYRETDICFFPSHQKYGLSRVPLEAMACGCLVISYGNEGSGEVIRNGETGFIIPDGEILFGVRIIEKMLKNIDQYGRIVQHARKQVEHNHTLNHYAESIEAFLYESLQFPIT